MSMNPCLQPACVSDVPRRLYGMPPHRHLSGQSCEAVLIEDDALRALYDAEWQKRGFERSP